MNNINCITESGLKSLIKNSALKLAEANLLQQAAATQGGLVGLQTAAAAAVAAAQAHQHHQQQEIAAKRIRFACPQLIPAVGGTIVSSAPALIPIVNHQQLIQPQLNPTNNNTNSIIQQQQMLSTFHHHQQVAAMAAAAAAAANNNNNLQTSPKEENGINISINENGRNEQRINGGELNNNINDYNRYGDPTKFATPNNDGNRLVQTMNGGTISQSYQDLSSGVQHQPNSILRIIIECMLYPVTLDVLYMIFSRYGKVLRIITFNKNNSFQALIQLSESSAAMNAKGSLDGLNIYNGCCTLRIEFSKLNTLNVKYNNDKSRDYTNPNLPSGELTYEQKLQLILQNTQLTGGHQQIGALFPFGAAAAAAVAAQQLASVNTSNGTNGQFPFNGQMALQPNNELLTGGGQLLSNNLTGIVLNSAFQSGVNTPVVLVSNLDEATVTPEQLFILFGVYGDVIRVKILFNKKDNALIQYSDVQQAQLAIQHLDKLKWNGRNIRVTASKHNLVQMPKEGQPDAGLTKEFTNSSLHRFKKPGSKNYMNIYPPCSTLHLSNIPNGMDEDQILEIFKDFKIAEFKFFQKDHKMALVQLEDVETAVSFLVAMHNYKLAENAHLRVSFSKKGMT